MEKFFSIDKNTEVEITVKKSKFIANLIKVDNQEMANEKLKEINGLQNLTNINGDCGDGLPKIAKNFDTIIIDPPRKGVDKKVIQAIDCLDSKKFIYNCKSNFYDI